MQIQQINTDRMTRQRYYADTLTGLLRLMADALEANEEMVEVVTIMFEPDGIADNDLWFGDVYRLDLAAREQGGGEEG